MNKKSPFSKKNTIDQSNITGDSIHIGDVKQSKTTWGVTLVFLLLALIANNIF